MIASVLLARFLGIYLLMVGATMLIRRDQLSPIARDLSSHPALLLLSGVMPLVFGLIILLFHNVWAWNWSLPITLIGYLAFFKGWMRLWFPDYVRRTIDERLNSRHAIIFGIVAMLLGVYFAHHGFLAQHL
jgi:uncharacterized membrane protein HdeD (DUF308 family)